MNKYLIFGAVAVTAWIWRRHLSTASAGMSIGEASRLLNVSSRANAEEVQAAHKRLITRVHPDTGGSAELASRVNQARDVLLHHLSS